MLQRVDWKKSQYQTPSLPAIPERVMGKAAFSCLTHRDQAEWTFLFEEIASIPSPYANNQDFDFDTIAPRPVAEGCGAGIAYPTRVRY